MYQTARIKIFYYLSYRTGTGAGAAGIAGLDYLDADLFCYEVLEVLVSTFSRIRVTEKVFHLNPRPLESYFLNQFSLPHILLLQHLYNSHNLLFRNSQEAGKFFCRTLFLLQIEQGLIHVHFLFKHLNQFIL